MGYDLILKSVWNQEQKYIDLSSSAVKISFKNQKYSDIV